LSFSQLRKNEGNWDEIWYDGNKCTALEVYYSCKVVAVSENEQSIITNKDFISRGWFCVSKVWNRT